MNIYYFRPSNVLASDTLVDWRAFASAAAAVAHRMPALRPRAPMQLRLCPILDLVGWRAPLVASTLHCAARAGACYYFLSLLQYVTEYFTK
jgi:hypothetical protein